MTTLETVSGIQARIFTLPNRPPFMIATDLAEVYATRVDALTQAVRRNPDRFPEDFCFTFMEAETEHLKTQNVLSNRANRAAQRGFTHAGGLMLSAVLKTPVAAEVSVIIHRAFARMEAQALEDTRAMLLKLRTDVSKKPIYHWIVTYVKAGYSFDKLWRDTNYSRPKLVAAIRELLEMAIIPHAPEGTPFDIDGGTDPRQQSLFGDV